MASLPYVTSPGNIDRALKGIQSAATPERVTQDFVKTILKIPGGSGDQMTAFLKKIGFVNSDGTPSELYKRFRNAATAGAAATQALKIGYSQLFKRNEFALSLADEKLKGLIIEETGHESESNPAKLIFSAIKAIKKFAGAAEQDEPASEPEVKMGGEVLELQPSPLTPIAAPALASGAAALGMNLSYTINLNLPATADVAVFNAIFKSLKENLLSNVRR